MVKCLNDFYVVEHVLFKFCLETRNKTFGGNEIIKGTEQTI